MRLQMDLLGNTGSSGNNDIDSNHKFYKFFFIKLFIEILIK